MRSIRGMVAVLLVLVLSSFTAFMSYADVDIDAVLSIQKSNEYIDNYYGLHLGLKDDVLYNLDKHDNIVYGYSYDSNGNIYYTNYKLDGPGFEKEGILRDVEGKNGVYFDADGHLVNPSTKLKYNIAKEDSSTMIVVQDVIDYDVLSEQFEKDRSLEFRSVQDVEDFLEYYILQYSLDNLKADRYKLEKVSVLGLDGKELNVDYKLTLLGDIVDREQVRNIILDKFGKVEGDTTQEIMYNICDKINTIMGYNLDYEPKSLEEAVIDSQGVCWQYAKIAKILLDEAGIENELMLGFLNGKLDEAHAWLRITDKVYDDIGEDLEDAGVLSYHTNYYYMDPTTVKATGDYKYSNIGYREYCRRYEVSRYVDIY